jgi:adenylate cyclase
MSQMDVAERAGVDPGFVQRLVEVGVLGSRTGGDFTEGDVRRVRLYQGLERTGLPIPAIREALDVGELSFGWLDHPLYSLIAPLSQRSFRDVADETGIPPGLLMVVREAIGFALPDPDDPMREDELRVVPLIQVLVSRGFPTPVVEQCLRVYGDAFRRIAETEAEWWRKQVTLPSMASGLSQSEMHEATIGFGEELAPLIEQAMLAIYHAHQEHTWSEDLIEEVEVALDHTGLRKRLTTTPAICFLDISGYTRLTEERGDEAAAELAMRLTPIVQRQAERHGGKVVKWLGDGVMIHFRRALNAVPAALDLLDAIADAGLPPAHVGIETGPVVFEGGDYFGRTVNLAARIAEQALAGQVLLSDDVAGTVDRDRFVITSVGPVRLKGVSDPVHLHAVERRS